MTNPTYLADAEGVTYYYVDASHLVTKDDVQAAQQIGSVAWSIAWHDTYAEELRIAAASKTVTFTVAKEQNPIYLLANNSAVKNNAMSENFSVTITVAPDGSLSGTTSGTLYFRVDGGATSGGSYTPTSSPLEATIAATGSHSE
ncbi:MAG: hypothetical protein IJU64_07130 [Bacilli bacterium]|nr:hypothetical protein [Bacilli bacterium]